MENNRPDRLHDPENYTKRLAIVVPYRDRLEHLKEFVPHMCAYFGRDKLDRNIPVTINIIEQQNGGPFNRGKINNCGFALVKDSSDYVSFHDVDYLPMWADYSWSKIPARLIWFGLTLKEDWNQFFGGVSLFDHAAFIKVNGFPNCYWGWGQEDVKLSCRCRISGYDFEKRDGTYFALPHKHAGFLAPGVLTDEASRTYRIFREREPRLEALIGTDGLSNLDFKLIKKEPLVLNGRSFDNVWHYLVDIK
jgi:hypothetical protein